MVVRELGGDAPTHLGTLGIWGPSRAKGMPGWQCVGFGATLRCDTCLEMMEGIWAKRD